MRGWEEAGEEAKWKCPFYLGIFYRNKASTVCQSHTVCIRYLAWNLLFSQILNPSKHRLQKSSMTSARKGNFLATDGYSIPGLQASPERCQDVEWNSHGEADWHFFTPMCLISAATSRHVGRDSHSVNAAPSHRHIRTAMGAAAEQIGQWRLLVIGRKSFKPVKLNKAMKYSILL